MVVNYPSNNYGPARSKTLGVVIHSTRGGAETSWGEFMAAVQWLCSPASQASAHAVVGLHGDMVFLVDPDKAAWHAREYNMTHLGLELVQPKPDDTFSIEQLEAAAQVVAGWCRRYNIPLVHDPTAGLAGHDEIPPGIRDGKTDPGEMFPWGEFIPRVQRWYMVHGG